MSWDGTQPPFPGFDLEAGKAGRDEGMARVIDHTEVPYREQFEQIVRDFKSMRKDWTSEDVTARIGLPPNHPNAVGALTRGVAISLGAVKVGRTSAQRKNQHATEIAVWGWR